MYSLIVVIALFISIILNDVLQDKSSEIPRHALFGLVCTLGVIFLLYYNLELVAWGLLALPITALILSFIVVSMYTKTTTPPKSSTTPTPTSKPSGSSCAPVTSIPTCNTITAPVTPITPLTPITPPATPNAPSTVSLPVSGVTAPPSLPSSGVPSTPSYTITPSTGC